MRALSADLRLRIHEACQAGDATADVADRFAVSPSTVRRLKRQHRLTGSLAPRPGGRGPAPELEPRLAELRQAARDRPGDTPAEHAERLGLGASRWTVWRAMRRVGLTRKKSPPGRPGGTAPT